MREIKFRARHKDKWVYGAPVKTDCDESEISFFTGSWWSGSFFTQYECLDVDPETVGQFIEVKDRNGKEIYEGDILGGVNGSINLRPWTFDPYVVKIEKGVVNLPDWIRFENWDSTHYIEVIGNIFENAELINEHS